MSNGLYYKSNTNELEIYQKLIQYWSMIFDKREELFVLDNMNFNLDIFPEIIKLDELIELNSIEPGYTSPDGYTEMNTLIRDFEHARLFRTNQSAPDKLRALVDNAGLGCGNGCTNVMNGVINSIIKLKQQISDKKLEKFEIILILPNYTVYTAQLSNISNLVEPVYIYTKRENNFLPTFQDIKSAITDQTAAVIITYPNNPAQSTYDIDNVHELENIVNLCQENEIFLIVDNIYQDLLFSKDTNFVEIFNLTSSTKNIVKVYGSSKDTPFF